MKVALFDIDGTLLVSDGAGRRALNAALLEAFGVTGPETHWFDGKTDRQIVRELMRAEGFRDSEIDRRMEPLLESYLVHLNRELSDPAYSPRLLAGVLELLDALEQRADVAVGLLTGNLQRGAAAKLARLDLAPERFRFGAFGSDHEHRDELPPIALARACAHLGCAVPGTSVVVIGDTPADIRCGRGIGARAIGVATGRYTTEELAAHAPAGVLPDLRSTMEVLQAILDE